MIKKNKQDLRVPEGYRQLFTYEEYVKRGWKEVYDTINDQKQNL